MAILVVNELPSYGSVNRLAGNIYHWYQTRDTVYPFDPIIPKDYGYYVPNFDSVDDGFLPAPESSGWMQIPRENLPVDVLDTILVLSSPVEFSKTLETSKTFSTILESSVSLERDEGSSPVSSFNLSITKEGTATPEVRATNIVLVENQYEFSGEVSFDSTDVRESFLSPEITLDIASHKIEYTSNEAEVNILDRKETPYFSPEKKIDITTRDVTYAPEAAIDLSDLKVVYTGNDTALSLVKEDRQIEYSSISPVNFVGLRESFSGITTTNFTPLTQQIVHTLPVNVDVISALVKSYSSILQSTFVEEAAVCTYGTSSSLLIGGSRKDTNSPVRKIDVSGEVLPTGHSAPTSIYTVAADTLKSYSAPTDIIIRPATLSDESSIYSPTMRLGINSGNRLNIYSALTTIDIAFDGIVRVITDEDWILLKRFGTGGWRWLSFLWYRDETRIEQDLDLDISSNYMTIISASEMVDVTFDVDNPLLVTNVIYYWDDTKTTPHRKMSVAYAGDFPILVVTSIYNDQGQLTRTATENFDVQGSPNYYLVSTGVTLVDHSPPAYEAIIPSYPSVVAGDPVYMDAFARLQSADATDVTTGLVVGFASFKTTAGDTALLSQGMLNVFTGLIPTARYFLAPGGGITTTPPSAPGNILKFVGVAMSSTQLLISLQEPLTIRS